MLVLTGANVVSLQPLLSGLHLPPPHISTREEHLAVHVGGCHNIVVHQHQLLHSQPAESREKELDVKLLPPPPPPPPFAECSSLTKGSLPHCSQCHPPPTPVLSAARSTTGSSREQIAGGRKSPSHVLQPTLLSIAATSPTCSTWAELIRIHG